MKKATRVRIMGVWIKIKHVEGLYEDQSMFGEYDSDIRTIRLEEQLEGDRYKEVHTHEKFQALCQLSGQTEILDDKVEEALAVMMEHWK